MGTNTPMITMTRTVTIVTDNNKFNQHNTRTYGSIEELQDHLDYINAELGTVKDVIAEEGITFEDIKKLDF